MFLIACVDFIIYKIFIPNFINLGKKRFDRQTMFETEEEKIWRKI